MFDQNFGGVDGLAHEQRAVAVGVGDVGIGGVGRQECAEEVEVGVGGGGVEGCV